MVQQIDYQFTKSPTKLYRLLDKNCKSMLIALIDLDSIMANEDGWFYRSNADLQIDADLSENLVRVVLDTLYQAGIINVFSNGKGRRQTNRIHINFESFKKYEAYSFNDIRSNQSLKINTLPYKDHYSPSYLRNGEETRERTCEETREKVSTIIDTTNTIENNIILVNETREKVSTQQELPTCKIDIVEEEKSLKEFEEESLKDMKDSFHIECSKVKINDDLKVKGFKCCEDFLSRNQNLDYQLLLRNSQQFLEDNDFKLTMLTQRISLDTGVTFSKKITTELLKEYVVGKTA